MPFSVRDTREFPLEPQKYTMPGPCAEYTALSPGCQDNRISLQTVQAAQYQLLCDEAKRYTDPVVLVYR